MFRIYQNKDIYQKQCEMFFFFFFFSQTNESRAGNLNMEILCDTQINVIQFLKKIVALKYKIT